MIRAVMGWLSGLSFKQVVLMAVLLALLILITQVGHEDRTKRKRHERQD